MADYEGRLSYPVKYKTQGTLHDEERLGFHPGPCKSGVIKNGVAFWHPEPAGGWVISFESLADMYRRACEARGLHRRVKRMSDGLQADD